MRENAKDIAQRVRGLREDKGVSATEMAAVVQVAPEQYAAYESAAEDIPASALTEIAARLDVPLGLLLTGQAPTMSQFAVTRKGRGAQVDRHKGYDYENLAASFKGASFEPFLVTVPATAPDEPVPQNIHPGHEFHYVLQGRIRVIVGEHDVEAGEGDSVIFDASKPHGIKAIGGEAKFIAIINV